MHGSLKFLYHKISRYHEITVAEKDDLRFLFLGHGKARKQSCVDAHDLHRHMLNYSTLIFSSLLFVPNPDRILVVGLGGGIVPRELVYYLPTVKADVIELDPEIVDVAKRFFFFRENSRIRVRIGDGREVLMRLADENDQLYDIIILDAFNSDYIPRHLMTTGFLNTVKRKLANTGVVAANIFNSHPLYPEQVRTYIEVFGVRLYKLKGTSAPSTTILFAQGQTAPALNTDLPGSQTISPIASLGLKFGLEIPEKLKLTPLLANAAVLTD